MRAIFLSIFTILLISCKNDEPRILTVEQKRDILGVAKCIIDEKILKYSSERNDRKPIFCIDLPVISFISRSKPDVNGLSEPPPMGSGWAYMENLLRDTSFFKDSDSFYFHQQYYKLEFVTISLDSSKHLDFLHLDAISDIKSCYRGNYAEFQSYHTLYAPIFSKDHTKAFLNLAYHCGGECGQGMEYYLSKVNGQWKIVRERRTWIS